MTHAPASIRPGLTAIAAVLALSATPLIAQEAAPVIDAPSPVTADAPAAVAVPSPVTAAEAPAATMASAPTMAPIVNTDDAASESATVQAANAAPAASQAAPVRQRAARTAAGAAAAPTVADAQTPAASAAPVAAAAPVVAAETQPVAQTASVAPAANDDLLPIAGVAGLGVLALAGGAFAYGRRRRADASEREPVRYEPVSAPVTPAVANPATAIEPAVATPRQPAVPAERGPAAAVADDRRFDLSRYGAHVQAAYRGPTPDNPSLNLKRRLKRAMFFDQRERAMRPGDSAVPGSTAKPRVDRWAEQPAARPTRHPTSLRPAFQG